MASSYKTGRGHSPGLTASPLRVVIVGAAPRRIGGQGCRPKSWFATGRKTGGGRWEVVRAQWLDVYGSLRPSATFPVSCANAAD
ncbi:MAG: hypothetical protein WB799_08920 [Candidatus Sulfotelmatobacter sp.]